MIRLSALGSFTQHYYSFAVCKPGLPRSLFTCDKVWRVNISNELGWEDINLNYFGSRKRLSVQYHLLACKISIHGTALKQ